MATRTWPGRTGTRRASAPPSPPTPRATRTSSSRPSPTGPPIRTMPRSTPTATSSSSPPAPSPAARTTGCTFSTRRGDREGVGMVGRRRWGWLVLVAVVAATVVPVSAEAAPTTGSIVGTVTGPGGTPVEDVFVFAFGTSSFEAGFTDANGHYALTALAPGEYFLDFSP